MDARGCQGEEHELGRQVALVVLVAGPDLGRGAETGPEQQVAVVISSGPAGSPPAVARVAMITGSSRSLVIAYPGSNPGPGKPVEG
jgi:hypothetical protein